jgi:hypothetical protein
MLILRSRSVRRVVETSRSRCRLGSRHSATAVFMITSTAGRARPGAPVVRAPLGIRPRCYHSHQRAIRYSHNLIEQRERLRGRHPVGPTPQRIRAHDLAVRNHSVPMWNYPKPPPWPRGLASRASDRRISLERRTKQRARAVDGAVCRAVSAPPEAVSVQRASARRHQLSVTATPIAATRSGSSSWMIDTWLAAAAPPIPIHSAGDA